MLRASLVPAWVLHTRPYRNTSLIVELFTRDYGRISAVAKSARGPKSRYRGLIQPFVPLSIEFFGDGELKTLGNVELSSSPLLLKAKRLFCGYYLNELLMRLLAKDDAHERVFDAYQKTVASLINDDDYVYRLRRFEWLLLDCLGLFPSIGYDVDGDHIDAAANYQLIADRGFQRVAVAADAHHYIFSGANIIEMSQNELSPACMQWLKHMNRYLLKVHLGEKPLFSRRLIQDLV